MKSTLIILSFLSIGITSVYAQSSNRYDWGIEGGPNFSTMIVKNNPYVNPKPAIFGSGGFIFQYNTKKILSFKTGFSFQQKGAQSENAIFTNAQGDYIGTGKSISTYDYITLPLLVKASFGKKVQFFVNAGPYGGFLLAQTDRWKLSGYPDHVTKNDFKYLKRWDFGFAGGIGVSIPIKEVWAISVEARNYSGILNLNTAGVEMQVQGNGSKIYTNTTDLRIGVVYKLGFRDSE
ncbi:porin family protein [Fluviicola chungangensis]|uniref:PorT family protein n=1 Tax=Fluviicola chungangensis TaxID=2597671 RepID=A0A556MJM2_9FLAO|nr:porin family protein [Fluviicola chungangensis]TSJ40104.1 PorT family protein [Fluviicola chungangensis]